MQRRLRSGELGDDRLAVRTLLDESLHTTQLPFGTPEAVQHVLGVLSGESHEVTIYLGGYTMGFHQLVHRVDEPPTKNSAIDPEEAPMSNTVITCPSCKTRNRVANDASGRPRCSKCHTDLPWVANVGSADFDRVVASSALPMLVDLWAPWCGPCRTVAPALEQLAVDLAGSVRVVKVNVDEAPEVSARLGVQGIPTMVLFEGGSEIARQVGALPAHAIRKWVDTNTSTAKARS